MCRLLAYASNNPQEITPYLFHLSRLASSNPHGWGIAYHRTKGDLRLIRRLESAFTDPLLREVNGKSDRLIGHVRFATNGQTINASSVHPFLFKGIVLAHNGRFDGSIEDEAARRKVSDSLVFLEVLAERWKDRTAEGLRDALGSIMANKSLVGDYSGANLLIMSGKSLYAFRCYRTAGSYYTLYLHAEPGLTVVSSEKLDGAGWRELENMELVELNP